jgi:phosphohistidine phosphatase
MKTLHIVRHGKALQDYLSIGDDDRPLIEKGILNSISVAGQLRAQHATPGLIVSSFAARALHTAHIFAKTTGYPHERVQVTEKLYMKGEDEYFRILESLPDELNSVMLVGHNPDVTFVANRYGCSIDYIPTSVVVTIHFKTERWSNFGRSYVVRVSQMTKSGNSEQ